MQGKLFIISGPSGVGKSTIRKELINTSKNIWYSVSATTRQKREGEQDGIDYYFLTKEEFFNNIKRDNFIEYVEVYNGTFYGTLKSTVMEKLCSGINTVLEIDVDGALKVKEKFKDAILIFIAPPSINDLYNRLVSRKTDSKEKIKERLKKAEYEMSLKNNYDYVIINDNLDEAIKNIKKIVNKNI